MRPSIRADVLSVAFMIAVFWSTAVYTSSNLQTKCAYRSPIAIAYIHEAAVAFICAPALMCLPSSAGHRRYVSMIPVAILLALIAFAANVSFLVALHMTSSTSAITMEQATPVVIAALSFFVLGERYSKLQVAGLVIAVSGSIMTVFVDNHGSKAKDTLIGDALVVNTVVLAAVYMVLFKLKLGDIDKKTFAVFSVFKSLVIIVVGGVLLAIPGVEKFHLPDEVCGWTLLSLSTVLNVGFNLALSWGIVVVSPLAARLFMLLGLPLSLAFTKDWSVFRLVSMCVVLTGVGIFELSRSASEEETKQKRGWGFSLLLVLFAAVLFVGCYLSVSLLPTPVH